MSKRINIAFYEKKDWEQFLRIIDDRENMFDTWEEWHQSFLNLKNHLIQEGIQLNIVIININELVNYCNKRKIKLDGKARSQFVAIK